MNKRVSINDFHRYLLDMMNHSTVTIRDLINFRTFCNPNMRKDPRVAPHAYYSDYNLPVIGMLELINGMFTSSGQRIAPVIDVRGELLDLIIVDIEEGMPRGSNTSKTHHCSHKEGASTS